MSRKMNIIDDENSSLPRGMSYGGTGGASSHRG